MQNPFLPFDQAAFGGLTVPTVLASGVADGFNPCAFALLVLALTAVSMAAGWYCMALALSSISCGPVELTQAARRRAATSKAGIDSLFII